MDVSRRSADLDRCPGAQERPGPTRPGPAAEDDTGVSREQDRWTARGSEPPQEWLGGPVAWGKLESQKISK